MTPRLWGYVIAVLLVAASHGAAYHYGWKHGFAERHTQALSAEKAAAEAHLAAVNEARTAERAAQQALNAVADQHEKDKTDALAIATGTADALRADNRRLRSHWQGCAATARVSGAAIGAGQPDADAELRAASAGRIVGAGAEADRWIERLQDALRAYEAPR